MRRSGEIVIVAHCILNALGGCFHVGGRTTAGGEYGFGDQRDLRLGPRIPAPTRGCQDGAPSHVP